MSVKWGGAVCESVRRVGGLSVALSVMQGLPVCLSGGGQWGGRKSVCLSWGCCCPRVRLPRRGDGGGGSVCVSVRHWGALFVCLSRGPVLVCVSWGAVCVSISHLATPRLGKRREQLL